MNKLFDLIDHAPVFDAHEHLLSASEFGKHKRGLIDLIGMSYVHDDLIASGMKDSVLSPDFSDEERWNAMLPYLEKTRNTSFYRSIADGLREIYDPSLVEIDQNNWERLNELLLEATKEPYEWYQKILQEKAKIKWCVVDMDRTSPAEISQWKSEGLPLIQDSTFEPQLFYRIIRIDGILAIYQKPMRMELAEDYQLDLESFDHVDELIHRFAGKVGKEKTIGLKCIAAYSRSLTFPKVERLDAVKAYEKCLTDKPSDEDVLCVQNYILHKFLEIADQRQLPFQFHTGLLATNFKQLYYSDPLKLNDLFLQYPNVKFVIMHGGYPFSHSAGMLAKMFPNVHLDISWLPMISYGASKHMLAEWLDAVPMSKFLWGGDNRHVEVSYGAALFLRRLLKDVLSEKVNNGDFSEDLACRIAECILYKNGLELFGIDMI